MKLKGHLLILIYLPLWAFVKAFFMSLVGRYLKLLLFIFSGWIEYRISLRSPSTQQCMLDTWNVWGTRAFFIPFTCGSYFYPMWIPILFSSCGDKNSQTFLLQKLIQIYYREKYTSGLNGKPGSVRLILPVSLY